jgi:hypothetical protein
MTEADHWKRAFDWAEAGRQVLKKTAKKLEGAIAALEAELAALEQRRGAYSDRLHSARAAAAQAADERAEATKQLEQALLELQAYIVQEQQIAELAQLAGAKGIKKIWFEVSPKKAITIRGLRRPQYSPVLFQEELLRILAHRRPLLDFIRVHQGELSKRVDKTWKAGRLTTR